MLGSSVWANERDTTFHIESKKEN